MIKQTHNIYALVSQKSQHMRTFVVKMITYLHFVTKITNNRRRGGGHNLMIVSLSKYGFPSEAPLEATASGKVVSPTLAPMSTMLQPGGSNWGE